jgi:hypothetical protein
MGFFLLLSVGAALEYVLSACARAASFDANDPVEYRKPLVFQERFICPAFSTPDTPQLDERGEPRVRVPISNERFLGHPMSGEQHLPGPGPTTPRA